MNFDTQISVTDFLIEHRLPSDNLLKETDIEMYVKYLKVRQPTYS